MQIAADTNTDAWMAALEQFLRRYLGPRRPEFREPEKELQSTEMPAPLRRFFRELMFGSEILAVAPGALEKFEKAGLSVERVWNRGQYAYSIDRPSYFLADKHFLPRAPNEADGDDWYECNTSSGGELLTSLGLPMQIP
jgi:hypothetical protein